MQLSMTPAQYSIHQDIPTMTFSFYCLDSL